MSSPETSNLRSADHCYNEPTDEQRAERSRLFGIAKELAYIVERAWERRWNDTEDPDKRQAYYDALGPFYEAEDAWKGYCDLHNIQRER